MNTDKPTAKEYTDKDNPARKELVEELLESVIDLRKAWIAPHRFSEQKASLNVARLSDAIQQFDENN